MDINILRGIATVIVMAAFLSICWWAYFYRSKESFNEAADAPFADEHLTNAGSRNLTDEESAK